MVFNSLVFVLFFLVFYPVYRVLRGRARLAWLLLASYAFYAYWDWRFLSLLWISTAVDYGCGLLMERRDRRFRRGILAASIVTNLGLLGTFKYLGFFVAEASSLLQGLGLDPGLPALRLALPIGLSFFTFQSMAYSIDVYRGRVQAQRDPLLFAAFIAFFPQLVAGPIERAGSLQPQLAQPRFERHRLSSGTWLVLQGYFKKVYIADNLESLVFPLFGGEVTPDLWTVLLGAWAFSWQIYCDFSGYTDIARGLARWMGIDLSLNFDLPFFAHSPQDLWRRWHITLSRWLRDYLYIPLGGNRGPLWRTQVNLMLTMLLGGFWHGASWTFVAWGLWHGVGLAVDRAVRGRGGAPRGRLLHGLAILATFHFTALGFLIFRAGSLGQVLDLFAGLATWTAPSHELAVSLARMAVLVVPLLLLELAGFLTGRTDPLVHLPRPLQAVIALGMVLAIYFLGSSYGQQFIYFQF